MRGWWGMPCWNGLSGEQQLRLIEVGVLEFGYRPEGDCENGAVLCIETQWDPAPGPTFYCLPCAAEAMEEMLKADRGLPGCGGGTRLGGCDVPSPPTTRTTKENR